jgi:hypothetical protein
MRADLTHGTQQAHDCLTVGGIFIQLQNSGLVFRIQVLGGLLLQLLNSEHERPPLWCHMRRRIHAQERSDTQGSKKRGERAREREEREVPFYFFLFISHCSSVRERESEKARE